MCIKNYKVNKQALKRSKQTGKQKSNQTTLTLALDTSVFIMITVVHEVAAIVAVTDMGLETSAVHIIKHYRTHSRTKGGIASGHCPHRGVAQLAAHHTGINVVPVVIAYGTPLVVDVDLNASTKYVRGLVAIDQSQRRSTSWDLCGEQ